MYERAPCTFTEFISTRMSYKHIKTISLNRLFKWIKIWLIKTIYPVYEIKYKKKVYVPMSNSLVVFSGWKATDCSCSYQNSNRQRDEAHPPGDWVTVVCTSLHNDKHSQITALDKTVLIISVDCRISVERRGRGLHSSVDCWQGRKPNWLCIRCKPGREPTSVTLDKEPRSACEYDYFRNSA